MNLDPKPKAIKCKMYRKTDIFVFKYKLQSIWIEEVACLRKGRLWYGALFSCLLACLLEVYIVGEVFSLWKLRFMWHFIACWFILIALLAFQAAPLCFKSHENGYIFFILNFIIWNSFIFLKKAVKYCLIDVYLKGFNKL